MRFVSYISTRCCKQYKKDWFYLYHSSNNQIERLKISEYPTIDFTQHLAVDTNLWGGVFTDYGGKGAVATAIINDDPVTFVKNKVQDDGIIYVGESNVSGATQLFNSNNQIINNVTSYTPIPGQIYYIKENPSYILNRYFYYTPKSGTFTSFYVVTTIDALVYTAVNIFIKEENAQDYTVITPTIASSLSISNATMKAYNVFRTYGVPTSSTAFLCYSEILNRLEAGKSYIFKFNAVGIDGVTIESKNTYKLIIESLDKDGISVEVLPNND